MVARHTDAARRVAVWLAAALLGGCASQAYDPVPAPDAAVYAFEFDAAIGLEEGYRVLYARLRECLAASSYRVQPRFDRAADRAWVMVVSGIGLDRYSFVGNRFEARFDLRGSPSGARVEVAVSARDLDDLARAARGWLSSGAAGCGR